MLAPPWKALIAVRTPALGLVRDSIEAPKDWPAIRELGSQRRGRGFRDPQAASASSTSNGCSDTAIRN